MKNTYTITATYPESRDVQYAFNKNEGKFYPYNDGRESQTYETLEEAEADLPYAVKDAGESARVQIETNEFFG